MSKLQLTTTSDEVPAHIQNGYNDTCHGDALEKGGPVIVDGLHPGGKQAKMGIHCARWCPTPTTRVPSNA